MRDLNTLTHFKPAEDLVNVLIHKTQTQEPLFFRILTAYYFSKVASMMRCDIATHERGIIPVNMYAINLAVSGFGKGYSTNILEEQVINKFRDKFLDSTLELQANKNINDLALARSNKKGTDFEIELQATEKEYEALGAMPFSFDSGTSPAVKQVRHKALMSGAGSLNFEMDEIASNLLSNTEVLTTYLELFDVGKVKQKLTKNTSENKRNEDIPGRTPTNMMLFGTPTTLLDGGKTEEEFDIMLASGYARRCFFGYITSTSKANELTPTEIYDLLTSPKDNTFLSQLSNKLGALADSINFNRVLTISKDISILLIEYKLYCESIAITLGDHEEAKKAELSHRYFKALKLAGAYAFIDGSPVITEDLLYNAIKLVEESGEAFEKVLTRQRNYVKLAKYIASIGREVTHVDLVEDLPCYKGNAQVKQEMMTLAIAYGYKNNIIIKKAFVDGIEFLSGESLKETNLDEMIISYSKFTSDSYRNDKAKFDKLAKVTQNNGFNWVSHHLHDGHRRDSSIVTGFNLLVLDVDGGTSIDTARLLLSQYKLHIYTTKSHTDSENRFRIVMPMNYELKLNKEEYNQFMLNVYEWLPFAVDTATKDRARKWASNKNLAIDQDGELFDVLPFIPQTQKNEERQKTFAGQHSLSNLERYFINNIGEGNRSNQLIKFALLLVDMGDDEDTVVLKVKSLNDKISNKLSEGELIATIFATVHNAIIKRGK